MLLIHVGRRTGLARQTVLEILEYRKEGPEAVVMSAFGPTADWLRNIETSPDPEVVIGSQPFFATYRVLDEADAVRVITGYEQRNWLIAPIIPLDPEASPRLAIQRLARRPPPARTASIHRIPSAIVTDQNARDPLAPE